MPDPKIAILSENQVLDNIKIIARLRIDIFREYPYLYDGDFEYESKYLKKFSNTPDSIIIVLIDGDKIVGIMTGLPLIYEGDNIKSPWIDNNLDIESVYYFSEILLYPSYRGKKYGKRMFEIAEEKVISFNRYNQISLATVIREEKHPQKPKGYIEFKSFWQKRGYEKQPNLICHIPWKDVGEEGETDKPLMFWIKK